MTSADPMNGVRWGAMIVFPASTIGGECSKIGFSGCTIPALPLYVCRSAPESPQKILFMFKNIPFERVNWITSSFLIGTLFLSLTAVPTYLWFFGLDWF